MKYICLGYMDEKKWEAMTESEVNAFWTSVSPTTMCFERTDTLWAGRHSRSARHAAILKWRDGKVSVTDGPFTETKEQLGGLMVLEAPDLNHAIQLMSNHPSVRMRSLWEIRPAADLTAMIEESQRRRALTGLIDGE